VQDALLYVLGILIFLLGIALSVGLHELGHYIPAKRFGVQVRQFMVGFGPTVFSRIRGETEFGVKAFPLGGYILMSGMYPPAKKQYKGPFANWINEARKEIAAQEDADESRKFYQLSAPKKMTIMLGGPVMNLLLGVLLILVSLSGIGTLQNSLTVAEVYQCLEVDAAGNCDEGVPATPASLAGLQSGDEVTAVNGQSVSSWAEVTNLLDNRASSQLSVLRDGASRELTIEPVFMERAVYDSFGNFTLDEQGNPITQLTPVLGIRLQGVTKPLPLDQSLSFAGGSIVSMAGFIIDLPNQVYQVTLSTLGMAERDPNGAVSIVGVGQLAGELTASELGIDSKLASLLLLLGSLNLVLFVFNLVPLLPLDGGHVVGAIYEGAKRRVVRAVRGVDPGPIDTAQALPLAYFVWVVLIFTGLLLILADLVNPITLG
jgi:membrane-associated protease RseP (regulator of RpoE activity)